MSGHRMKGPPEVVTTDSEPHLAMHDLVKLEVRVTCSCKAVVRTSETLPRAAVLGMTEYAETLRRLLQGARDHWEEHQGG